MLTAILVAVGIIAYLNIGYWWGNISWRIWRTRKRSLTAMLCFPINYSLDKIGDEEWKPNPDYPLTQVIAREFQPLIAVFNSQSFYAITMTFVWPLKLVWNVPVLIGFIGWKVIKTTPGIIIYPASKLLPKEKI
ncbi:MAG: hypothetical protein G01um101413_815 [Parcubacteria group bacterium Gr01-1014_13]|nr:MAG: hypothetical protein G01um101413_815 [Parcubacteria group bacterium Gr01-1014_13]